MVIVSIIVSGFTIYVLYEAAFRQQRERLVEVVQSQARLIEAIARFDSIHSQKDHPEGASAATLSQIIDAHKHYKGFGETGEFTLAKREGNNIIFLLSHRHYDLDNPKPIPFNSELAEPMRRALLEQSGTVIGADYRGKAVLAAYEPVKVLNLGIVAKIDLSEIRESFVEAAILGGAAAFICIVIGAFFFIRISEPLLKLSEQRREELIKANEMLKVEIIEHKQAKDELHIAKQQAEAANLAKTQFLANMSHEIRTPLNSIIGFSQVILDRSKKISFPENFHQFMENIHFSGKDLSVLINNILDLSRIEAGKIELAEEDFNLRDLVKSISTIYEHQATQKGVVLSHDLAPELPHYIHSDRCKLTQILINLIGNAIKFTPTGKEVKLKVMVDKKFLEFVVIDQGIGIPKDRQEVIFNPFEQVDGSISRQFGGTGLGLAITKRLVELLKGKISVVSRVGYGSNFNVTIPFKEAILSTVEQESTDIGKQNLPKDSVILVVDDNPMNQVLIKVLLEDLVKVNFADDGQCGIEKTLELKPDLILMDIQMPGIDGMEATKQIRQNPEFKEIPIVALSADAFVEQKQEALDAGMTDYLVKPIELDKLMAILYKYLHHK
jgi:signal transduction histidine kinase/CheY-like chemotaxis protein